MSSPVELALMLLLIVGAPLLGVLIRAALRLVYGARGPADGDDLHAGLTILAWALIVLGAVMISFASLMFGVVITAIFCGALLEYVLARRRLQRQTAWAMLNQATRRGHSVAELVSLQKSRFSGVVRNDLEGFAWQVANGESLPMSVAIWRRAFPREAQGYAAIGKQDGTLPVEPDDASQRPMDSTPGGTDALAYLAWVGVTGVLLVTGVMIFIVPAFRQIFLDFSMDLPRVTQTFLDVTAVFKGSGLAALFVIVLSLGALAALVLFFCYLADVPVLQGLTDRLMFARHRGQLLRLLAIAAERGQPFAKTLQNLAMGHPQFPVGCAQRPLQKSMRAAASGVDWKDALARVGLLKRHELPLLAAAEKSNNLPWALRALSERIVNRSHARWEAVRGVATVGATIVVGLLVMWFCVAMFAPLVKLISNLA